MKLIVLVLLICVVLVSACDPSNDPLPSGGAACTTNDECGAGSCEAGGCVCPDQWTMPDCTHERVSRRRAGGLQIGLLFAGVGGVGNFLIKNIDRGVGQLILYSCSMLLAIIPVCLFLCILGSGARDRCAVITIITIILVLLSCALTGFIWSIVDGARMLRCEMPDAAGYALFD